MHLYIIKESILLAVHAHFCAGCQITNYVLYARYVNMAILQDFLTKNSATDLSNHSKEGGLSYVFYYLLADWN